MLALAHSTGCKALSARLNAYSAHSFVCVCVCECLCEFVETFLKCGVVIRENIFLVFGDLVVFAIVFDIFCALFIREKELEQNYKRTRYLTSNLSKIKNL
uniref:Uncharacterized protein n=1 Tax=Bactrocera dorsalis TaxID=27457 RepID=A0A034VBH5_BACDO